MSVSALIGAWLAGSLGGLHCLAMCGGFVTAMAGARPGARFLGLRPLAYNAGRITTYVGLGLAAGGAGGELLSVAHWIPVQRALYVVANVFLLGLAVAIVRRRDGSAFVQRLGHRLFGKVLPVVRPLAGRDSFAARYGVGIVWGLVPCALTYSVLPIALFAGGAAQGAAVMLAFGVGTLPNLLAAAWMIGSLPRVLEAKVLRWGAALLLAAFAGIGMWRALVGTATLGQGPFCF
jgi:sulfite exporter TauE/SafE